MTSDELIQVEEVVVRDSSRGHDLGKRTIERAPSTLKTRGSGELRTAAFNEVRETFDLEAIEPGTVLATVTYDLDAWKYSIEYEPIGSLLDRLRRRLP
jgi:hypothetical protein